MGASDIFLNALFYLFAVIAVAGVVGVAASRNIVRSAFALLAVLFSTAALYALMKADFIAAAQVLIYVGGILVLIIFAVMLTHRITDVKISNESTPGPAAFCAVVCLLFALVVIILPVPDPHHNKWDAGRGPEAKRYENSDYTLLQFQADGKTGLALGGGTFEDEAVVGIRADKWPDDALRVMVEVVPSEVVTREDVEKMIAAHAPEEAILRVIKERGSTALSPDDLAALTKAGASDSVIARMQASVERAQLSEPIAKNEPQVLVRISKLKERKYAWKVKVVGGDKDLTGWMSYKTDGADFEVHRGVTQPIAFALSRQYLFAFEAISVLLLAALVGAAFLARKEVMDR